VTHPHPQRRQLKKSSKPDEWNVNKPPESKSKGGVMHH